MRLRLADYIVGGVGVLLIIAGGLLHVYWTDVLDAMVAKTMMLSPDPSSKTYQSWKNSPVPMSIQFYFWNWTNPEQLLEPNYKPEFVETGPYRFREKVEKVNITWNSNGTVSYRKLRRWYFEPELSNGTLKDEIITLNVVALTAALLTKDWSYLVRLSLSAALSSSQAIHIKKTVGELLFDGYSDSLISLANNLPSMKGLKIPYDKFGWFYQRNGSYMNDGLFNMATGENDINELGVLKNWNYKSYTKFYEKPCSAVVGSAGEFWPPKRTKEDVVKLFSPDLCRYISFYYSNEEDILGLRAFKYRSGAQLLDNGTIDRADECFCGGECVRAGVLNVSSCRLGAPAFVSYPHFYLADEYYTNSVIGMKPDQDKHDVFLITEPYTGVPLKVSAKFQINILLQPDPTVTMFKSVPRVFFPIIWFEQEVEMPDSIAGELRKLLKMPFYGSVASLVFLLTGVCLLAWTMFKSMFNRRQTLKITTKLKSGSRTDKSREIIEKKKSCDINGDSVVNNS